MFNRLSQSFISLTEREQLVILRKMIEGDLGVDLVLRAESLKGLRGLLSLKNVVRYDAIPFGMTCLSR